MSQLFFFLLAMHTNITPVQRRDNDDDGYPKNPKRRAVEHPNVNDVSCEYARVIKEVLSIL